MIFSIPLSILLFMKNLKSKSLFLHILSIIFVSISSVSDVLAQPANDDPCNATPLTVGTSCTFISATNVAATNSAGVPAPGCASYSGQDVWFSVFVPASGILNIDSNVGGITDGGMAAYSGACNSLSLISCNDDGSANGLMPQLYLTGLTPGTTIFIRFWEYGGGTGTFSICVSSPEPAPPCGASPAAGNTCATATPICNLNGYCGNTSASYTANSWSQSCGFLGLGDCGLTGEFCGSIENNSFLSFVASATSISFDVWVNSSTLGYGIQIFIFSSSGSCSGTVTQYGPCYNPGVVEPGPVNITAGGLTVGNTYYIMIDGNAGDVCSYTIGANSGISIPVLINPSAATICPGETVNLTASGGNGTYTWNATPQLNTTIGSNVTATPPGPGTYTYTVNSATGNPLCPSSTSATATITVDNCGCTVNASNSGNVCPGGSVNLFATDVIGATYSWSSTFGFSSTSQNPTSVVMPTTPGTYDITVTATLNGVPCTSTTTVTVNPLPTVGAGSDQTVCDGTSVALNGTGASAYTWSGGVSNGVSFVPGLGVNNYTVTGTSAEGCENTDDVVITVVAQALIEAGNDVSICSGQTATLTASGGNTYVWNNGLGAGNGFTVSPAVTTVYSVVGTDANGCTATDDVTVTVNALPVVNAGMDQTVCEGTSVTLIASGALTYNWDNGVIDNTAFIPTSTMTYTVTGTSAEGCTSTDQVTVNVNALPAVNAGLDQVICIGESVTLSGAGANSYSWSNSVVDGVSFNPANTNNYTVSGTDANGCVGTDIVLVTVNPLPIINGGADVTVCEGDMITLAGAGGASYAWSDGGIDGQAFTPSLGSTVYTVSGTDANGCVNTDEVTVTVLVPPTAGVDADVQTGYPVLDVTFTNFSTDATSYIWSFGNNEIEQTTTTDGQFMSYSGIGTYIVVLTATNGVCVDADTLQIVVIPFPDPILDIPNVFTPNGDGVNDHFTIDTQFAEDINILIFNRWGNQVAEINGLTEKWDGKVDGKDASDGTYFFKYNVTGINGAALSGHGNVTLVR